MVLGYPEHGVRCGQPVADFAAWATACGGYGALAHDGPALVDVDVDPHEPPQPGKVGYEQAKGIAQSWPLCAARTHKAAIASTMFKDRISQLRS